MDRQEEKENLINELKNHLQSNGWETHHAEVVVDGIVESFNSELLPDGFASYDELAKNQGVGAPLPFDEKAITLFDEIKQL